MSSPQISGNTVYIDPSAATDGNGSQANPYNTWLFGTLQAGTTYLQRAGTTYTGVIHDQTVGTAAAKVVIGAYGTGAAPQIIGSIDFAGAAYARFAGFHLTSASYASVIIQQGSSHIEVADNTISGSGQGIWIGNKAGGNNWVHDNTVLNSAGAGILVQSTTSTQASPTIIAHNTVYGSGNDGIQIVADYVAVLRNTVSHSGLSSPGSSGIHVYASSATSGGGQHDSIIGNVSVYNQDHQLQDGNGILLDQWTSSNLVADNLTFGNDGAGVALYDSSGNIVRNNTVIGNGLDPAHSHSIHADLVLNDMYGLTANNVVSGNTLVSTRTNGVAAFVSDSAATAHNSFSGNVLENLTGHDIFQLAGVQGVDLADWNVNGTADRFTGVHLSMAAANESYAFDFTMGPAFRLDGALVHVVGWSQSGGLFGT